VGGRQELVVYRVSVLLLTSAFNSQSPFNCHRRSHRCYRGTFSGVELVSTLRKGSCYLNIIIISSTECYLNATVLATYR
jgi:hypothetical protein